MIKKLLHQITIQFFFIICFNFADDVPEDAAYATWDYKIHNVGKVEQS